jgi:hypothetical protein
MTSVMTREKPASDTSGNTPRRTIRMTDDEWAELQKLADAAGLPDRSAYLRALIDYAQSRGPLPAPRRSSARGGRGRGRR